MVGWVGGWRIAFFRAWPWPGRGRGRGHGHGRPGGWDSRLAGWPAGRGRWSVVGCVVGGWVLGCPGVRVAGWPGRVAVAVAGGRGGRAGRVAVAGWPGGRGLGGCLPSACIPSSLSFRAFRGIYPYTSVPIIHAGQEQSSKPAQQKKSK